MPSGMDRRHQRLNGQDRGRRPRRPGASANTNGKSSLQTGLRMGVAFLPTTAAILLVSSGVGMRGLGTDPMTQPDRNACRKKGSEV